MPERAKHAHTDTERERERERERETERERERRRLRGQEAGGETWYESEGSHSKRDCEGWRPRGSQTQKDGKRRSSRRGAAPHRPSRA